jgi:Family of unknown function (DUF6278)
MGPKHGIPRGVAVFGSPGFDDPPALGDLLSRCARLRSWGLGHGIQLMNDPNSLTALDSKLDDWQSDPTHHGKVDLTNDVGIYLGHVIVTHVDGSHWQLWPNGHPVVRLKSGTEIDVISIASDRLERRVSGLGETFAKIADRS